MAKSILVVEDNKELLEYLREILSEERYSIYTSQTGAKALKLFQEINPDLVLLDLTLPDVSGETLKTEFKSFNKDTPVVILTADSDPSSIARNLREGADDYIIKPFTSSELLARIAVRIKKSDSKLLKVGDVIINTEKMEVSRNGKIIELTPTEYELLFYLVSNKDRVVTREMILSRVWSQDYTIQTRVVDVYIGYLRKKLGGEEFIHSKRGYGYIVNGK